MISNHYIKRTSILSTHMLKSDSGTTTTTTHSRPSSPPSTIQHHPINYPPPILTLPKPNQHQPQPQQPNLPSSPQINLQQAMEAELVDGKGNQLKFQELIDPDFKTLVIFIRHFRSGYSQRYIKTLSQIANREISVDDQKKNSNDNQTIQSRRTTSSVSLTTQSKKEDEKLGLQDNNNNWISANGVKVIIIGNGNYQLIDSYRTILNCPFPIYTDLSKDQKVYKLLGMKKIKDLKLHRSTETQSNLFQVQSLTQHHNIKDPFQNPYNEPPASNQESKIVFLSKVLYNAWRMPWKWSGDPQQLGGELVFEPIREEKRIKRKPIKYKKLPNALIAKSTSTRSVSSTSSTSSSSENHYLPDSQFLNHSHQPFNRRPSCAIRNNNSIRKNHRSIKETVKEIQVQCKFIHQMTNYRDHSSIDELMMMSGIRLTSLIQRF